MSDPTQGTSGQPQSAGFTRPEGPGTRWGRRHPRGVTTVRLLVAVWLAILGAIFCAFGQWWGVCFFAGAALVGWLAYKLPRSRARTLLRAFPAART
jgi:hypothetical protein